MQQLTNSDAFSSSTNKSRVVTKPQTILQRLLINKSIGINSVGAATTTAATTFVKKRRFRSWVWEYFIPTDRKTATCSICKKVIVHGNPTSHLINHLTKGIFSTLIFIN